jgi:hypothetical protein
VIDRLRELRVDAFDIKGNRKADRDSIGEEKATVYANKRAEMWGTMREWLQHSAVPAHPDLLTDLTGLEYGYTIREGRDAVILERKEDMKKRGLASPDLADALALSFAYPVVASDHASRMSTRSQHQTEYDPPCIGAAPGQLTTKSNITRSPSNYAGRRTRTIVSAETGAAASAEGQSRCTPLSEFLNPLDLSNYP